LPSNDDYGVDRTIAIIRVLRKDVDVGHVFIESVWSLSIFKFSDSWKLVIRTVTTIITRLYDEFQ
jgi:hypothetical protein